VEIILAPVLKELGPIVKDSGLYVIHIQDTKFYLVKEAWKSLVAAGRLLAPEFREYLKTKHPDIRAIIKPKEALWFGELYVLIRKAGEFEDKHPPSDD